MYQIEDFQTIIKDNFRRQSRLSTNESIQHLENLTDIKDNPNCVRAFMKRIGFIKRIEIKCRKFAHIPTYPDKTEDGFIRFGVSNGHCPDLQQLKLIVGCCQPGCHL